MRKKPNWKDFINFAELSRFVSGNKESVRKTGFLPKYEDDVKELEKAVESWIDGVLDKRK